MPPLHGTPLRLCIYTTCLSAFLFFGYDQGVLSGLLPYPPFQAQFRIPDDTTTGAVVASYCFGALFGCILNFSIGELLGRKKMIMLAMVLIVIGASLQASAFGLVHLIIVRVITGLGTGIDSSTIPMYQSELSAKGSRGRQVSWEILFIGIGITFAYWVDYGFTTSQYIESMNSSVGWRTPIALQLVFALVVLVVVQFCPESPRWLAKNGRMEEAIDVLSRVHGLPVNDERIVDEVDAIRAAVALEEKEGAQKWFSVFVNDKLKTPRRVALGYFALFMNQLSGINLVVYYLPTALGKSPGGVGLEANTALLLAGCVQLMFPIGNLMPALFLDRIGRRWTMIIGCGLLSIMMAMIAALLSPGRKETSTASITFFFLYMLIFGGTVNVIPWVWGPELLPLTARTRGTAISVSSHWLWNAFIVFISPIMINRIQWKTYIVFMTLLAAFVPIVYFFYPETSNLSLEEIDLIFLPESMGGLNGNARIRMTPKMAAERAANMGLTKDELAEKIEHAQDPHASQV